LIQAARSVGTAQDSPFTVFAPVHAAFAALPAGTVDTLLKPENKGQLTKILTYRPYTAVALDQREFGDAD
jgi:uncharacterized surface protein with fasciclin (FAS1) repeats